MKYCYFLVTKLVRECKKEEEEGGGSFSFYTSYTPTR